MLKDKTLLITGGTGSFAKLYFQDSYQKITSKKLESLAAMKKSKESMRIDLNNNKVKFYIGDIRDYLKALMKLWNRLITYFMLQH